GTPRWRGSRRASPAPKPTCCERHSRGSRPKETSGTDYGATGRRDTARRGRRGERARGKRVAGRLLATPVPGSGDLAVAGARPGGRPRRGRGVLRGRR